MKCAVCWKPDKTNHRNTLEVKTDFASNITNFENKYTMSMCRSRTARYGYMWQKAQSSRKYK